MRRMFGEKSPPFLWGEELIRRSARDVVARESGRGLTGGEDLFEAGANDGFFGVIRAWLDRDTKLEGG